MQYDLKRLQADIAQVWHEVAGFCTGRLVAENLILTAAHVLWNKETGAGPEVEGWQVRLAKDYVPGAPPSWPFHLGNRVVWHDRARDLALIQLVNPGGDPLHPLLQLRIATVGGSNLHSVEARGYPRASKEDGQRELTPAFGRLTAADRHRPLRFGVDSCDLPNDPHVGWPGMSGSAVLLRDGPDPKVIWVYGVVQEVPANFDGQLRVARLADAWQQDARFRRLLVDAGADDEDSADPTAIISQDQERSSALFAGVPARNSGFTGRGAEFDRLDAALLGSRPFAITQAASPPAARIGRVAVHGMGGVGKTSFAAEYAHRYRDFYAGVWWCPAQTRVGLLTSLAELAVELGAAADGAEVERAAKASLERLARQRTPFLLVYDNVASPEDTADLLPASGAYVLITSRFPDWGGWAEEVALDLLPLAEAVAFLQSRAGRRDEAGATVLAEALGRLPLALDHAAAVCCRTQMRFAEYAAKVETLIDTAPRGAAYPRSVAATFGLAITEALKLCSTAGALVAYLGQCGPERIPLALVEGAIEDEAERNTALVALTEVALVRHDPFEDGAPAIVMHRLVRAVARAWTEARGTAISATGQVIERLLMIYPDDAFRNPASWPLCVRLTPHVLALQEAVAASTLEDALRAVLFNRAGSYFHRRAAYQQAEELFQTTLTIRERVLGRGHHNTASCLANLAGVITDRGDPGRAQPLYERTLAIYRQEFGPQHPNTVASLGNLASVLQSRGDLPKARQLHELALEIRKKTRGPGHPDTAMSMSNLGHVIEEQGDLPVARRLYEDALKIRERELGPGHPDTATSLHDQAGVLQAQGDFTAARPLFDRALAINERVFGPEHPNTALTSGSLASLLLSTGHPSAALPLAKAALATLDRGLGQKHVWTIRSARIKADVLDGLGWAEEAIALRMRYNLG